MRRLACWGWSGSVAVEERFVVVNLHSECRSASQDREREREREFGELKATLTPTDYAR